MNECPMCPSPPLSHAASSASSLLLASGKDCLGSRIILSESRVVAAMEPSPAFSSPCSLYVSAHPPLHGLLLPVQLFLFAPPCLTAVNFLLSCPKAQAVFQEKAFCLSATQDGEAASHTTGAVHLACPVPEMGTGPQNLRTLPLSHDESVNQVQNSETE